MASMTPSGCIVRRDRSVVFTFGPFGDDLASLLERQQRAAASDPACCSTVSAAIDAFLAEPVDPFLHPIDLGAIGLGERLLSIQPLQPRAGGEPLVKLWVDPSPEGPSPVGNDEIALPLDVLLDRIPAIAFVLDEDDRFVFANGQTAMLFGMSGNDLLGSRAGDLVGSNDVRRDIVLAGSDDARTDGYRLVEISATEIDLPILRLHRSVLDVGGHRFVASIALDPTGQMVTRSRASDREMQLGRLVDLMPAPVWVIGNNRRIIRMNDAARALRPAATSHIIGAHVHAVYPTLAPMVFGGPDAEFESLATTDQPAVIFSSVEHDQVFRVDRTLLPGAGGPASAMAVMLTDLSEVHGAQQELQMKNEVLEHRNAELDQFAHMASHDLRAPLRAIYAFTQMAIEDDGDEHREHLGAILNSVDRMRSVLDSLLDFATANTNPVFSDVSLADVVESVLGDLASDIAESGASVKVGELPVLRCDETSMRRLFQNLISNAIAYAGNAPASITITSTPEYRFVEIVVTDRGIGFPQHQEQEVFRPFKRLSADSPGQGIGLSMCRRIVESHHGTIRAISQIGGPTSMVIRLPRRSGPWR